MKLLRWHLRLLVIAAFCLAFSRSARAAVEGPGAGGGAASPPTVTTTPTPTVTETPAAHVEAVRRIPPPTEVYLVGVEFASQRHIDYFDRYYYGIYTVNDFINYAAQCGWGEGANCGNIGAFLGQGEDSSQVMRAGTTFIVDQQGKIQGTLATDSLYGQGLPGMTAVVNESYDDNLDQVWVGPATATLNGVTYQVDGFVSVSPIIIDVAGDGRPDVDRGVWQPHADHFNIGRARMFDIEGSGEPEMTEWLGPHSGLLCMPIQEARVAGGRQLFGTAVGYVDGYQKLALLRDKNHDGVISNDELDGLCVWIDQNQDGKCQPDELHSVQSLGITEISCRHKDFESTCQMNGQRRLTWDWWPTVFKVHKVARAQ